MSAVLTSAPTPHSTANSPTSQFSPLIHTTYIELTVLFRNTLRGVCECYSTAPFNTLCSALIKLPV